MIRVLVLLFLVLVLLHFSWPWRLLGLWGLHIVADLIDFTPQPQVLTQCLFAFNFAGEYYLLSALPATYYQMHNTRWFIIGWSGDDAFDDLQRSPRCTLCLRAAVTLQVRKAGKVLTEKAHGDDKESTSNHATASIDPSLYY